MTAPAKPGENIRAAGLEARAGDVVVAAGEVVTPAGAGLLANAGHAFVPVHRAPRVGIISLGTELVDAGAVPARGQIVNGPALMASAREAGAEPVFYGIAPDDEERICELVRRAASECDVVVTSGGASAGDYDYVTALIEREGEVLFDRVSIKPGKAVTFGLAGRDAVFRPLKGNPAGAFVGFELFVAPSAAQDDGAHGARVARSGGARHPWHQEAPGPSLHNRARVERAGADGELEVMQAPTQNSALLVDLHRGNCLLMLDEAWSR
ncbi:MAG: molybdopterin molybdotransferase MoeA [Collinsella sp.]